MGGRHRRISSAHPYEEPAFDIYPVENVLTRTGLGRQGTLAEETTMAGIGGADRGAVRTRWLRLERRRESGGA